MTKPAMTAASAACELCGGPTSVHAVRSGLTIHLCRSCRLAHLDGAGGAQVYERYRGGDYFQFWGDDHEEVRRQKRASSAWLVERLEDARDGERGRLLEVGCASGELLEVAYERGWDVAGVELCEPMVRTANARLGTGVVAAIPLEAVATPPGSLDAVVFNDVLEHLPVLEDALRTSHRLLRPGGTVLVSTPDLESLSARLMGPRWTHYKAEHLHYLSRTSTGRYLERTGFELLSMGNAWKSLSPAYLAEHLRAYGSLPGRELLHALVQRLPAALRHAPIPLLTGNLLALARKVT